MEGSNPTANVTGLLPGTEYTFTVVAVSVSGDVEAFSDPSLPFNASTTTTGESTLFTVECAVCYLMTAFSVLCLGLSVISLCVSSSASSSVQ